MEKQISHPYYGKVIKDDKDLIICHICGKGYKKVLSHVWQTHGILGKDYKKMFGLDVTRGLIAESTKKKLQKAVNLHYDKVVASNLIEGGRKTRYKEGHEGRTACKMSEQTRLRLRNNSFKA